MDCEIGKMGKRKKGGERGEVRRIKKKSHKE